MSALTADVTDAVEAYLAQPTNFDTKDPRVMESDAFRAGVDWAVKHVDWRVLAGFVPGSAVASLIRDGDRVRVAEIEGSVLSVSTTYDRIHFTVLTDAGAEIVFERTPRERVSILAVKVVES